MKPHLPRLAFILLASTTLVSCVRLADTEAQIEAHDYESAFSRVALLAKFGDPQAQNRLGWMLENGLGTNRDPAEAARWYREAAIRGLSTAQNNLGILYREGRGVTKDSSEAARWFEKAAAARHPGGLNNLAVLLDHGEGVPENNSEAAKLFAMAAEAGNTRAKTNLGILYRDGEGVPQDLQRARQLFEQAASEQGVRGMTNLGVMLLHGEGGPADRTRAIELFRSAARGGESQAAYNLAATISDEDLVEAYAWANIAASQRLASAVKLRAEIAEKLSSADIQKAQQLSSELIAQR